MTSTDHKQWWFFEYADSDVRTNSSSEKSFTGLNINASLVRELIQNSLDAAQSEKQAVEVKLRFVELGRNDCAPYFKYLEQHYKACYGKPVQLDEKVPFLILEDFHTTGLEGKKVEDFFKKDNMRSSSDNFSGGSHGIGKVVFYMASRIKVFFAFSIYESGSVFKGSCGFKTHFLNQKEYREYGALQLSPEDDEKLIQTLFTRDKNEKGLSIAIPLPRDGLDEKNLERAIIDEYYYPMISRKLVVNLQGKRIDDNRILEEPTEKANLISQYITLSEGQFLIIDIGKQYRNNDFLNPKQIKEITSRLESDQGGVVIRFKLSVRLKKSNRYENGYVDLLLCGKKEKNSGDFDFWRENLLIKDAVSRKKSSSHYTAIVLVHGASNALGHLLRKLENPSHTRWNPQNPSDEVREGYYYIKDLVKFVTGLPNAVIHSIMRAGIELDSSFFSDFFPDASIGRERSGQGQSSGNTNDDKIHPTIDSNSKFIYRENRRNNGFILSLSETGRQSGISKLSITMAYGTNKGDPFKNYDIRDFDLQKNIKMKLRGGKQIEKQGNRLLCQVKEGFKITLSGFDPDRELKIYAKEEAA